MRAYELMIILDGDLEEGGIEPIVDMVTTSVTGNGGTIASVDRWGKRKFAYEIDHKTEGYYVVLELIDDGQNLAGVERQLRLADDVVRHKLLRLPDSEGARRGLLGDEAPAASAS